MPHSQRNSRFAICAAGLLFLLGCCVVSVTAVPVSMCDRLTASNTFAVQSAFVNNVADRIIQGSTSSTPVVPGLLARASPMLDVFSGSTAYNTMPARTLDTASAAYVALRNNTATFLAANLQCTAPGFQPNANLNAIVGLTKTEFDFFTEQVSLSLKSLTGITASDLVTYVVTPFKMYNLCSPTVICSDVDSCELAPNALPACALAQILARTDAKSNSDTAYLHDALFVNTELLAVIATVALVLLLAVIGTCIYNFHARWKYSSANSS
jgi:hypothetical protein